MGSKSRARRRRDRAPLFARGSSVSIQPVAGQRPSEPEASDAIPLRTEDGDDYVRIALDSEAVRRHEALDTWNAMCRVEQMLRERRRS